MKWTIIMLRRDNYRKRQITKQVENQNFNLTFFIQKFEIKQIAISKSTQLTRNAYYLF
uniref:Uncharacterized protein n=1 Tax=Solanum lycopersicum TaxID=4081 RepID=A0A3Q7EXW7_SOLLC